MTHANGTSYTGEWKQDKQNGKGECNYTGGLKYRGNCLNGKQHGHGEEI
jgi:hypothetical protein